MHSNLLGPMKHVNMLAHAWKGSPDCISRIDVTLFTDYNNLHFEPPRKHCYWFQIINSLLPHIKAIYYLIPNSIIVNVYLWGSVQLHLIESYHAFFDLCHALFQADFSSWTQSTLFCFSISSINFSLSINFSILPSLLN